MIYGSDQDVFASGGVFKYNTQNLFHAFPIRKTAIVIQSTWKSCILRTLFSQKKGKTDKTI